jgi:DNA-binding NarL/FixJ family response regulator
MITANDNNGTGIKQPAVARLTPRQLEALRLLARGFSYKEIAATLGVSHATVRAHLHATYCKLEVKSRGRAIIKLQELFGAQTN